MKKLKKAPRSLKSKALIILVFVVIGSTFFVSGSLSKYTTSAKASGAVTGALFNFNDSGTNKWSYPFLGVTPDDSSGVISDQSGDDYETNEQGRMLAPGQSGVFGIGLTFIAEVDAEAVADDTVLSGTGAYAAPFTGNLDTVALRFVVTAYETTPDFDTPYNRETAPNGYVITSAFEDRLEGVIEGCFGPNGYYDCNTEPIFVNETVYVYWEWVEDVNNDADTALSYNVTKTAEQTSLILDISVTVTQVELDGTNITVGSVSEFNTALANGAYKTITLGSDINFGSDVAIDRLVSIDLDGHTLTCDSFSIESSAGGNVTVSGGSGGRIAVSSAVPGHAGYGVYISAPNALITASASYFSIPDGLSIYLNR